MRGLANNNTHMLLSGEGILRTLVYAHDHRVIDIYNHHPRDKFLFEGVFKQPTKCPNCSGYFIHATITDITPRTPIPVIAYNLHKIVSHVPHKPIDDVEAIDRLVAEAHTYHYQNSLSFYFRRDIALHLANHLEAYAKHDKTIKNQDHIREGNLGAVLSVLDPESTEPMSERDVIEMTEYELKKTQESIDDNVQILDASGIREKNSVPSNERYNFWHDQAELFWIFLKTATGRQLEYLGLDKGISYPQKIDRSFDPFH